MKAIVQDRYGSPEVLRLGEVDEPAPRGGQVLVRVRAAGVDPGVWHLMAGVPYLIRLGLGLRRPRTRVRGVDFAGVVEAVGAGVTAFEPGDEVFGAGSGTFAEYAAVRADHVARKPASLTFEQAAAVPVSATTALQALRDAGRVAAGQRVLVIGAGGGVGSYAVQLAREFGATVTGVCGPSKVELVRSLGAEEVLDYTRQALPDGRFDLILDTAGNRSLATLRRALTPRGTLVIVGGEGGGRFLQGFDRQLRALALSPFIGQRLGTMVGTTRSGDLETLAELIDAGRLTPVVDRAFPLAEAAAAVAHVATGHARGKTVLTV